MPETAQPAPETDEKKSRGLGSYALSAFVAVMVYVLSSGPMLKAATRRNARLPGVNRVAFGWPVVYAPLGWAYDKNLPLHTLLGMYWHLWMPESFHKNGD